MDNKDYINTNITVNVDWLKISDEDFYALYMDGKPYWEQKGNAHAMGLLSKKKKALFIPKKHVKDITKEEFEALMNKAIGEITKRDYNKFLKNIDGWEALPLLPQGKFTNDKDGFAEYLYYIILESGLYSLAGRVYLKLWAKYSKNVDLLAFLNWFISHLTAFSFKKAAEVYTIGEQYGTTVQGAMINQLRQIGKRILDPIMEDDGIIYSAENIKLAFFKSSKFKGVAMTTPAQKVLSMYHEELCKILPPTLEELGKVTLDELGQYSKVKITLDRYMELTKTKDKKTARKAIKEACDRLYEISFIATVKKGKDAKTYKGRLFQSQMVSYRGGIYEMEFSNDFLRYCSTTTPEAFHHAMYQINGNNNPYAWAIGQKLRHHYEINRGKPNANKITVGKLLEAVQDIPTYEEVMKGQGLVNQRIVEPVERDLNKLHQLGVLKAWDYKNPKGAELTEEQLKGMDFKDWEKLLIVFDLDLPPQSHYIERHQKRIEAAKKKKAERQNKENKAV